MVAGTSFFVLCVHIVSTLFTSVDTHNKTRPSGLQFQRGGFMYSSAYWTVSECNFRILHFRAFVNVFFRRYLGNAF